jgi:predicted small lipoprotein YifL
MSSDTTSSEPSDPTAAGPARAGAAPPTRRRRTLAVLAAALVLVPGLLACGKKGPPLPPLRTVPITISDLAVQQQGRQLLLDFAYPATTAGGQALDGIDSVVIYEYRRPTLPDGALPPVEKPEFQAAA